jgi:hypothetical protein
MDSVLARMLDGINLKGKISVILAEPIEEASRLIGQLANKKPRP